MSTEPCRFNYFALRDAVLESKLGAKLKLVLLVYLRHVNRATGEAWPSIRTVARLSSFAESTVRDTVAELRKLGVLTPIGSVSGGRRPTRYAVNIGALNPPSGGGFNPPNECDQPPGTRRPPLQQTEGTPPALGPELIREQRTERQRNSRPPAFGGGRLTERTGLDMGAVERALAEGTP